MKFHALAMAIAATPAIAVSYPGFSVTSWGDPRVDVFGWAPDYTLWHKYWTGSVWKPDNGFEQLPANAGGVPVACSWGEGRFDIFYTDADGGGVRHKYYGGGAWGPSFEESEDLGGDAYDLAVTSWGEGRIDIVGLSPSGSYVHKAWTGKDWYPKGKKWEDLGGEFVSTPAVVSRGEGHLDIAGIAPNGSLLHLYYYKGWSKWENLGDGPWLGNPIATSWGPGRLDLWTIDHNNSLNHKYWTGSEWAKWEVLGGNFTDTPQVVSWKANKFDIVGKDMDSDIYRLKSFDGSNWNPNVKDWYTLAGPFASEPAVLARNGTNFFFVFGVQDGEEAALGFQIWTGFDWQPGYNQLWSLGDTANPFMETPSSKTGKPFGEKIMLPIEL